MLDSGKGKDSRMRLDSGRGSSDSGIGSVYERGSNSGRELNSGRGSDSGRGSVSGRALDSLSAIFNL